MRAYKKKIYVDVYQLPKSEAITPELLEEDAPWAVGKVYLRPYFDDTYIVSTLEGEMNAKAGDWLIKGVEGEVYAIDSAIFTKTYNLSSDEEE